MSVLVRSISLLTALPLTLSLAVGQMANTTVYDLFLTATIPPDPSRSDLLLGADEVLHASDMQILVSVPKDSIVISFNLADPNLPVTDQLLSDDDFPSLKGARGMDYLTSEQGNAMLAVTGEGVNSISLFSNQNGQWQISTVFSSSDNKVDNFFTMKSPHRLRFSGDGRYLLAISRSSFELYIFRDNNKNKGQPDWNYWKWQEYYRSTDINQELTQSQWSRVHNQATSHIFLITSYPDNSVYEIDPELPVPGLNTSVIHLDSDPENPCIGPSILKLAPAQGQYIVGCVGSDTINIYRKADWQFVQIFGQNNFGGNNLLDGVNDLAHFTNDEEFEYLIAISLHNSHLLVFRCCDSAGNWLLSQTVNLENVSGFRGLTIITSDLPLIFAIPSTTGAVVILSGKSRPVFEQPEYSFELKTDGSETGEIKVGSIRINFQTEVPSEAEVQLSEYGPLFHWENNTLTMNSTLIDTGTRTNLTFQIMAINERDQSASADVSVSINPKVSTDNRAPLQVILPVVLSGFLFASIVTGIAATRLTRFFTGKKSYSPAKHHPRERQSHEDSGGSSDKRYPPGKTDTYISLDNLQDEGITLSTPIAAENLFPTITIVTREATETIETIDMHSCVTADDSMPPAAESESGQLSEEFAIGAASTPAMPIQSDSEQSTASSTASPSVNQGEDGLSANRVRRRIEAYEAYEESIKQRKAGQLTTHGVYYQDTLLRKHNPGAKNESKE